MSKMSSSLTDEDSYVFLQPKEVFIGDSTDSEEETEVSSDSSDEDDTSITRPSFTIPPEYWHIQKLVKFLKSGNQEASTLALCCLNDYDLTQEVFQFAIQDCGGIEVFINVLETSFTKCKIGSLTILAQMAQREYIRKCLVDLGLMPVLVKNLLEPAVDVKILVAEMMYYLGFLKKARKDARHQNGIPLLVDLLYLDEKVLRTPLQDLAPDEVEDVILAEEASKALWSLSKSKKNMAIMMKSGCVPLMAKLLSCAHTGVATAILGTLAQCSILPSFQLALSTEKMVESIVKNLVKSDTSVLRYCCETILYAAENPQNRDVIRKIGGLNYLIDILTNSEKIQDKDLLAAATGAVWKTSQTPENVIRYQKLHTINILVNLLENPDEDERVLSNIVGALYEFLKFPANRDELRRCGGIPYIVNLLNYTYEPLLENLPMVLRLCAEDEECMRVIEEVDGVRLIWSLLKNKSLKVQAKAAWCLVPCIKHATDAGGMVRSFVGGLEIIVELLKADDVNVLSSVCAAISEIAKDLENLAIISDHGVVARLVDLISTEDPTLREHLCSAIASCCALPFNCKKFGRLRAVTPVVSYMQDEHINVNRTAAIALYRLSENYFNAVTMHESGVVVFLLRSITSDDQELQEAAAACLTNIRKLAFKAETRHLIRKKELSTDEEDDEFD